MTGSRWSSAICETPPDAPGPIRWGSGLVISGISLFIALYIIADKAIPIPVVEDAEVEEIVVSLGAPARRLEPPPPELIPDEPPPEEPPAPQVKTERAEEAPPPEAPPEPRYFAPVETGPGPLSSGLGPGKPTAPPPAPPPPPPPPPPVIDRHFVAMSTAEYVSRVQYPYDALRHKIEGHGAIAVRIDRNGRVLTWQMTQSTGHAVLDREIKRVASQVKQLDPLPDTYPLAQCTLIIPFSFVLAS